MELSSVDSIAVFWLPEVRVGDEVAFQLSLSAPSDISIVALPITSLTIHFTDFAPLVVRHKVGSEEHSPRVQLVNVGHIHLAEAAPNEVIADLRWAVSGKAIFAGTVVLDKPGIIKVYTIYTGP